MLDEGQTSYNSFYRQVELLAMDLGYNTDQVRMFKVDIDQAYDDGLFPSDIVDEIF